MSLSTEYARAAFKLVEAEAGKLASQLGVQFQPVPSSSFWVRRAGRPSLYLNVEFQQENNVISYGTGFSDEPPRSVGRFIVNKSADGGLFLHSGERRLTPSQAAELLMQNFS